MVRGQRSIVDVHPIGFNISGLAGKHRAGLSHGY